VWPQTVCETRRIFSWSNGRYSLASPSLGSLPSQKPQKASKFISDLSQSSCIWYDFDSTCCSCRPPVARQDASEANSPLEATGVVREIRTSVDNVLEPTATAAAAPRRYFTNGARRMHHSLARRKTPDIAHLCSSACRNPQRLAVQDTYPSASDVSQLSKASSPPVSRLVDILPTLTGLVRDWLELATSNVRS